MLLIKKENIRDVEAELEEEIEEEEEELQEKKYNSLWDIIDHKKNFNMLYSGVEDEKNFDILYDMGIRDFLISFHYVKDRHLKVDKFRQLGIKFFVDSGAFTYRTDLKYADYTIEDWEKHIESYLRWAEKNKDIIFAIANLDIEGIVDPNYVVLWNEKYFEPFMLRTGIPVCFIHHEYESIKTWEQYVQRYPYVGFPWEYDAQTGEKMCRERLRIAEKYNTVVHGMAMTKTSLLTSLPFYTVDSTTWMVGVQYGEVNYWTGTKMSRLKKDKWKGSMLPKLVDKGFDPDKLLEEDTAEMIRVNVHAFMEAEEYIQKKCASRMYWLKSKAKTRSESDLFDIKYPEVDWFGSPQLREEEWEEYAEEFNISKENKEEAWNLIADMTIFMNWDNPKYRRYRDTVYTDEIIKDLHDKFVNRIVATTEERVEDLIKFYKDNLLGQNTTLLYLGTNFDKLVKEREEYLSDEEYDFIDIEDSEMKDFFSKFLPPKKEGEEDEETAPEVDELEDEIFEQEGIIPVRDADGKFLKGQRKVLKPKKMFSKKFPKLACDTCYAAQKCPEYKAGYACAYNKIFDKFETRNMEDIIQAMQGIADFSLSRLQKVMMFEILDGGLPSADTTQLINQTMGILNNMKNIYESGSVEVIRQTNILRSDGTRESTMSIHNPSSGGILEKIFGNLTPSDEPDEEDEKLAIDKDKIVEAKSEIIEE